MKTLLKCICALSLVALFTTFTANAANLVDNPSFNQGLAAPNEWAPADWNVGAGGNAGIGRIFDDSADAGTNCLQLYTNDQNDGNYSQTITIPASRIYVGTHTQVVWSCSFKFAASGGGGPSGYPVVELRAFDSSDTPLAQDYVVPNAADYTAGVWYGTGNKEWAIPANTDYIDLDAEINLQSWAHYLGVFRVDDFQVDFIPEPTLLLSGLLLGLAFLRRK